MHQSLVTTENRPMTISDHSLRLRGVAVVRIVMRSIVLIASCFVASSAVAQDRVWTGQSGDTLKAELASVNNGQVLLKQGKKRSLHRLSEFSLKDREYIVDKYKRRQPEKISDLMQGAAKVKVADGKKNNDSFQAARFDGFKLPSPELKKPALEREWTDLLGNKVTATFERLLPPSHMKLKSPDGNSKPFPIVNFVRADLDYVRLVLKSDATDGVFPVETEKMTDVQRDEGYRTFSDRAGVSMDAKFLSQNEQEIVLEIGDEKQTYKLDALSQPDQEWVTAELTRRGDLTNPIGSEMSSTEVSAGEVSSSESPASDIGMSNNVDGDAVAKIDNSFSALPGSSGSSIPQTVSPAVDLYRYECSHCNRVWTSNNPAGKCKDCQGLYEFRCNVCEHTWTSNNNTVTACANCKKRGTSTATLVSEASSGGSIGRTAGLVLIPLIVIGIIGFGIWKMSAG